MKLFSTGLEQANVVITSNILEFLWNKISERRNAHEQSSSSVGYDLYYDDQKKIYVVTFVTCSTENELLEGADLVSSTSSVAKESFALFDFLHKKGDFAINKAAITLFHQNRQQLSQLKDKMKTIWDRASKKTTQTGKDHFEPIVVTGHALGGSIASLFTLWLLESFHYPKTKRPICITFGSPLIGDSHLQKALFQYSPWNSCFLHVVSNHDPIPRKFINHNANSYKPFGTFLLCSDSGCSCFEEPETILKLLAATASNGSPNQRVDYGIIVEQLKGKALFKNVSEADWATSPYTVGIVTQLSAIKKYEEEDQEHIKPVVERMEKQEKKYLIGKRTVNRDKRLNEAKINMAKLEWYKKASEGKNMGYYDTYKSKMFMSDINVEEIVKRLVNYWMDVVEEADKQPQTEGASLQTRWLYAGITYKKMVEPLCIADFYNDRKDCLDTGYERLRHFIRLEQLSEESKKTKGSIDERKKNISHNLTEDSCFWARVEEAVILCESLKVQETSAEALKEKKTSAEKLKKFEEYVMGLVREYKVSPEIFLKRSSFMTRWWEKYKEAMLRSYSSPLTEFITNRKYEDYKKGKF